MATLALTAFDDSPLCRGHLWKVVDEDTLALCVAALVIGDHLQAKRILASLDADEPVARKAFLDKQIKDLKIKLKSDRGPKRWHRDGWVFQMISWVAATIAGPKGMLIKAPQPRKTDKGPDGVMLMRSRGSANGYVIICEDKATEDARKTITDKVWPELEDFEARNRDGEIVSDVESLLAHITDEEKRREIVKRIFWSEPLRYRVCLTATDKHDGVDGRAALFEGYEGRVSGDCERRRAETLTLTDVRDWMDDFCDKVIAALKVMREDANV